MKRIATVAAAAILALGAGTLSASADACSGRSHDTGTALGALGGAAIGGLASHNLAGAAIGGVAGGFAGNAIARSQDCKRRVVRQSYWVDSKGRRHYTR